MAGVICARSLAVPLAASVAGAVGAGAGAVGVGAGALVAVAVGVAFVDAAGLAGVVALAAAAGLAGAVADGLGVEAAGARSASGKPEPAEVDAGLEGLAVAFAGLVAFADGVAVALPEGVADAPPVGVALGGGAGAAFGASTRTGRKRSCEDLLRESTVLCGGLPGSEMTMLRPPWVATSASATPLPSTRWRMMSTALSIWPWLMVRLPTTLGSRISCVPPSRSRPSLGVSCASPQVCTEASRP